MSEYLNRDHQIQDEHLLTFSFRVSARKMENTWNVDILIQRTKLFFYVTENNNFMSL